LILPKGKPPRSGEIGLIKGLGELTSAPIISGEKELRYWRTLKNRESERERSDRLTALNLNASKRQWSIGRFSRSDSPGNSGTASSFEVLIKYSVRGIVPFLTIPKEQKVGRPSCPPGFFQSKI
jgi:hypothetical protein